MPKLETVKIVQGEDYAIINKSDFDKGKHKLYEEPKAQELTVKEIKAQLDEAGIEYDAKAKKDELLALLG